MIDLINRIAEAGILLDVINGELKLFSGEVDIDGGLLAEIKDQKIEIASYLVTSGILDSQKNTYSQIPKCPKARSYPISDGQRRLWVLSQFEDDSASYNMVFSKSIQIKDIAVFKKAIDAVIDRHEILRTLFKTDETGELCQFILSREALGFEIGYQDYRDVKSSKKAVQDYISLDAFQSFNLENGPLIRASLLQISAYEYVFYYNMHHIIGDGWSIEVLVNDVMSYYTAFEQGIMPKLPELRIQYKDYAAWQLDQLNKSAFEGHKKYWVDQFSAEISLLDLPGTLKRPKLKTSNGKSLKTHLSVDLSEKLKNFCIQQNGTLFMGLLATLNALFYKYTDQEEFIIGCPVAGRDHQELENQIGFYINTLAMKNQVKPTDSFKALFSAVKHNTLQSYKHQQYPFDRLVEELGLSRDTSRNALFDVMLVLQNTKDNTTDNVLRESAEIITSSSKAASKVDLEFIFEETGSAISLNLIYNSDVYEQHMIMGLLNHFIQILEALVNHPDRSINQIDYMTDVEKDKILNQFNNTVTAYSNTLTVIDLFREQVTINPAKTALVYNNKKWSYQELDEQSNQLANCLQIDHQVLPEDFVGVKLDRSELIVVSILAVLKLGAAYVPVDPAYSSSREAHILNDSNVKLLITSSNYAADYGRNLFLIDSVFNATKYSKAAVKRIVSPGQLAYMIYTSGSTGMPKGVMVEHGSLMNYLNWAAVFYLQNNLQNGDFGLYTTLSFDLTVTSFFLPLTTGNTLWVFAQDEISEVLKSYLASHISCIKLTPAHISLLKELEIECSHIELAIVGGDILLQSHIDILRSFNPAIKIYNEYGPTEATVGCMIYEVLQEGEEILIGYPIFNTEIYILNTSNGLQPVGVVGELCIGGSGLARGYLNRPDLNTAKFVPHPFKPGERIYKTGDIARWLPDGNMAFLGRKDDQVKIRGYRIELGEIQVQMMQNLDIEEVLVLADENESGEKELVAFFVSSKKENINELRSLIVKKLPAYMLPSHLIQIEKFPLTVNGKTDKAALLKLKQLRRVDTKEYLAPENEVERNLVIIWKEVLTRDEIGTNDDFFALGGHSLKAIRLMTAIHKRFEVKLSVKQLFLNATVKEQAALIVSSYKEHFDEILPVTTAINYPLSYEQRRLWVLCQLDGGSQAFNMPCSFIFNEQVDFRIFEKAISSTIKRHEILRTVFKENEQGEIRQWVLGAEDFKLKINYIDLSNATSTQVQAYITKNSQLPFDLEKGPLLSVSFLSIAEDKCILHYNMHHIISDGLSMQILSNDVLAHYNAYKAGLIPDLKPLKFHYKDYAVWQKNELKSEKIRNQTHFWRDTFKDGLPRVHFPFEKQRPELFTYLGNSISFNLGKEVKKRLEEISNAQKGSMYITFLFLVKTLIHQYTHQAKVMVGSSFSTRTHHDLEKQLGFYVNNLPLITNIKEEDTLGDLYLEVRDTVFNISEKSWYPLEFLVDQIDYKYAADYSGLFNVLVEYHEDNYADKYKSALNSNQNDFFTNYKYNIPCQFDLSMEFFGKQDDIICMLNYNHSLFEEIHIELFKERLLVLIQQLISGSDHLYQTRLKDLNLDQATEILTSLEEGF